jgi:hypothetical protein
VWECVCERDRERVCVCVYMSASVYEYVSVCVYMSAIVSECVCVYVCDCVWVCVSERECVSVSVCVRERESARVCVYERESGDCVWVCVCLRARVYYSTYWPNFNIHAQTRLYNYEEECDCLGICLAVLLIRRNMWYFNPHSKLLQRSTKHCLSLKTYTKTLTLYLVCRVRTSFTFWSEISILQELYGSPCHSRFCSHKWSVLKAVIAV